MRDGKVQIWAPDRKPVWQTAADAEGMSLSAWLRRAGDRAVEAEKRERKIREAL